MRRLLLLWTGLILAPWLFAQAAHSSHPSNAPSPAAQPQSAPSVPEFEDVAQKAGLTVSHISSPDKKYIVESMSGGVGLIDCDNDGKLDIITVNGSTVQRYRERAVI